MTRWLTDFEVEAHISTLDPGANLSYVNVEPPFEVMLKDLSVNPGADLPLLSVQVILDANSARDAAERARDCLKLFLDSLAFVTNSKFSIHKLLQAVDWSIGLTERDCVQYRTFPKGDLPVPALDESLLQTVLELNKKLVEPKLRRALKWFSHGVSEDYLEDQFQYFWFVLEIVAEVTKPSEPVPDRCQRCRSPLFCKTCDEAPTHRPFPKQAIEQLIARVVPGEGRETFERFLKVRNLLLHGEEVAEIESTIGYPMERVVDIAGNVAWAALLNALALNIEKKDVRFLQTNHYTHNTLSVGAILRVGALGDPTIHNLVCFLT